MKLVRQVRVDLSASEYIHCPESGIDSAAISVVGKVAAHLPGNIHIAFSIVDTAAVTVRCVPHYFCARCDGNISRDNVDATATTPGSLVGVHLCAGIEGCIAAGVVYAASQIVQRIVEIDAAKRNIHGAIYVVDSPSIHVRTVSGDP